MPLLPVALYGLEVPAGDLLVPAVADFPATFRITMAAIDPTAPPQTDGENPSAVPRATLKLIRAPISPEDEDDESDDEDNDEMLKQLLGGGSDSESEDESDEEANGGPSDPAKSKKAQKAASLQKLIASIKKGEDSDEDMEDAPTNGISEKAKGKAKATDEDSDEDSEGSEDFEVEEFVICTLDPERTYQQALDITIAEGENVFFKVTGTHTIYLTGNYVVPDDDGHNHHHEVYDSEEESEDDEDYDLSPSEDELELQLEGEESDELDDLNDPRITELASDEEEEAPKLISKADKKGKNKRSADALEESLDDLVSKSLKSEDAKSEEAPKLSKKQLKKLKNNKGDAVEVKPEEVKENGKGDKKVQFAKNLEQGPTGSTPDKSAAAKPKATVGVKEVNGVKIDDKKIGTGPAAKNNNRVEMRYIGKFTDGKVFDSNKKGKPFAFKIGKGEVIKGWDIGVAGMQVGGERRLTIPPHLGYGSSGTAGIPKNATLVFDIKLLSIK